jgi:hypothetical protein
MAMVIKVYIRMSQGMPSSLSTGVSFCFVCFFETGFLCVTLAVLELTV